MTPVCIFAKPPVPAEVKTRLIPELGAAGAAQLASAMLLDTWRMAESCPGVRPVLATTRRGDFPMKVRHEDLWLQGDGDLGARIEYIMTRALLCAPAAIAIGADAPLLNAAHLGLALEAMRDNDAVVGPAVDGGFYLLALRRCPPGLFASLPWSQPGTLHALKIRLREHAFSIAQLETLFDIDIPEDFPLLAQAAPGSATETWYRARCQSCG
jgi:uncharacterized protein